MVLTKENVAAHAVAEHLVSLQLPDHIQGKMGRLVGYYEQNRKGSYTPLDILPSNRNQVIRQKSLLIGCGGGFQQECSQQFSPVADWMSSVDLFLEDEGQQYGNMEEAASVARTPATCLEVWSGDHRQTPGGLKKSKESKSFREKLTKPSLYEFYLVMIYRQQILPNSLQEFTRTDHKGKTYTPLLENVTLREIHEKIRNNPTLHQNLERMATFSSYCTISNTVKAIGIGGVASVFVSSKISDFLTLTNEAQARNLVALTRSKGLCILLLPSTDKFPNSSLHFLRTLCAFRHGMFSIGASPIDLPKLGAFITPPDVTHDGTSSIYSADTWQLAHQISWYGTWHCLPLAIAVSHASEQCTPA